MSLSAMQLICNESATEDGGCSVVLLMYCSSWVTSDQCQSVRVGSGSWGLHQWSRLRHAPNTAAAWCCMQTCRSADCRALQHAEAESTADTVMWWVRFRCVTRRAAKPHDECHRSRRYRHRQHQLGRRGGNWQSNIVPSSGPGINLEHWTFVSFLGSPGPND